jgi:TPR repeat protein
MNSTNSTPEDVLPYAPKWASQSGYRNSQQPNVAYDVFSEQENPSYRSMAELFSPQAAPKKRSSHTTKMLLRFGAVVGVAGGALALFVGYIATQPDSAQNGTRFKSVTSAVATVQAALAPASAPSYERQPPPVAAAPEPKAPAAPPVVEAVKPPEPAKAADISSDRGAAPQPPPAAEPAPVLANTAPAAPDVPKHVATLTIQPPLAEPAPVAPQLSAGELATLMARGRRFMESGDFSSARPVYRRAAEAGYAEAALALGETYDPRALAQRGAVGMGGDIAQARLWYEKARELGSLEAPTRLERLPPN